MLQDKLDQVDKQQHNKQHNRLKPQFPALGASHPMLHKLYSKPEH